MVLNTSSSFNEVCQKEDKFLIVVKFLLIEVRGRLSIRNSQLLCQDTDFFLTCVSPNTPYILLTLSVVIFARTIRIAANITLTIARGQPTVTHIGA